MINIPFATPPSFIGALKPSTEGTPRWYIFSKEKLLLTEEQRIPNQICLSLKSSIYMGTLPGQHLFAADFELMEPIPPGWSWNDLRTLYGILSDDDYAAAGRAMQLLNWDRIHKYCGSCGKETFVHEKERCRQCSSCGHLAYPKLAPAVMALVKRESKILLAHGIHFPEKFYSVIAGYVDPGETLEQCISREVFEEVGIKVKNICYFGSQPWPFSQCLMIAFTCDWEGGEISIDPAEITHADWFDHTNLPQLPPPLSISRILIDSHLASSGVIDAKHC